MLRRLITLLRAQDRALSREIRRISGYRPRELFLYRLALTHSSLNGHNGQSVPAAMECNERLEYLGDSVLDAVVAEYLFKIYPLKDEGFLTEMRSKIVNRKSLNEICDKLELSFLVKHNQGGVPPSSIYGDALEAFIGAVYLDLGFIKTRRFIHKRILEPYVRLVELEAQVISYKNKLIEYVQREKLGLLEFEVLSEYGEGPNKTFRVKSLVGSRTLGVGEGKNKKTAEQRAAEDALIKLNALTNGNGKAIS